MNNISQQFKIKTEDGFELFVRKDIPEKAKAIILIVHGLAEHCGRYDYVTTALNKANYGVFRFDLRGHGQSGGERGYVDSFHNFLDDAYYLVQQIKEEFPKLPVFLMGHSMGGFIAAGYGVKYPHTLDGEIFSGAAVIPLPAFDFLNTVDYHTIAHDLADNALGAVVCRDQEVVKAYGEDPLNLKQFTMQLAGTVLQDGVKWVQENIKNFDHPCLILHGGGDVIVPPASSEWLYTHLQFEDKALKIYPGLFHEIMNEFEKDEIIGDIVTWLDAKTA